MIIPSIIVYGTGNGDHIIETLSKSNQKSISSKSQKGQDFIQKSSLTIGWVSDNNQSVQHLSDYKNLNVVSPALASIDEQFNLHVNSDLAVTNTIHTQEKVVWARIIMNTDKKPMCMLS